MSVVAELAGFISLGFAAASIVDIVVRAGISIEEQVSAYKSTDKILARFKRIGSSMARGLLKTQLNLLHGAIQDGRVDRDLVKELEDGFKAIVEDILNVEKVLEGITVHEKTRAIRYVIRRRKLASLMDLIEENQSLFLRASDYVDKVQTSPSAMRLTSANFSIIHETPQNIPGSELEHSNIFVTRAEYQDEDTMERVEGEVVLEQRPMWDGEDIKAIELLIQKLRSSNMAEGVLHCLGFRSTQQSRATLAFVVPSREPRRSLLNLLQSPTRLPLNQRIKLCKQLAAAVSTVHSCNLVHKSIRPSNVLLVGELPKRQLFLTDWTLGRDKEGFSKRGGATSWRIALYQHPQRQGEHAESRYTILHDIYSLGVCMLEILLGEPFISRDEYQGASLSERFRRRAIDLREREPVDTSDPITEDDLNSPTKLTRSSELVKTVLLDLATTELPFLVGDDLVGLVKNCLQGFDGAFPDGNATEIDASLRSPGNQAANFVEGMEYIRKVTMVLDEVRF